MRMTNFSSLSLLSESPLGVARSPPHFPALNPRPQGRGVGREVALWEVMRGEGGAPVWDPCP